MKTIQMTIDDRLLMLVDKMSRARTTTRKMQEAARAVSFALGFDAD
jgi:hypothetical protein